MDTDKLKFNNGFGGFDPDNNEYVIFADTPLPWINCISQSDISQKACEPFGFIISEKGGGYVWSGNSREGQLTKWYCDPAGDPSDEKIVIYCGGVSFSPFERCTARHGFGYSHFTGEMSGVSWELSVFVPLGKPVKVTLLSVSVNADSEVAVRYSADSVYENRIYSSTDGEMQRVKAGDKIDFVFLLSKSDAYFEELRDHHTCACELGRVKEHWRERLGRIKIKTPDESLNVIMNGWLMYQTISCRMDGRTAFYQCGGAYGFRDQLQDSLALLYTEPEKTRSCILLHASRQYEEGDVQHWWHPPENAGLRSRYSDDLLWLVYVTGKYIDVTGDTDILSEKVPYLKSRVLDASETDRYENAEVSERSDTLFAHCLLACRHAMRYGAHGLPLIKGGDWNDGMNRVGIKGAGESVWLAWFLCACIRYICKMSRLSDAGRVLEDRRAMLAEADRIAGCIEKYAWDGAWYVRAFCDSGRILGTSSANECRIDSIAQSWAVLSDYGNAERAGKALLSAERYLVDRENGTVRLLTPPFTENSTEDVGYIASYPPGVRENGAQYTHAAVWLAKAFLNYGGLSGTDAEDFAEKGRRILDMLNPVNHARTQLEAARYKTEPYAVAADIYSGDKSGRGGWSWYTGSAAWLYTTVLEDMLGFCVRYSYENKRAELISEPRVPRSWHGYSIEYRYGSSVYVLTFRKGSGGTREGTRAGRVIPLEDDGKRHDISVVI